MPTVVDKQRDAVYAAEQLAFQGTALYAPLMVNECVGLTNTLFIRAREKGYWLGDYMPTLKFVPQAQLGGRCIGQAQWYTERTEGSCIRLAPEGKRGFILAHEVAHLLLMAGRPQHENLEGHGKEYAAVYIWAVSALFGIKWSNVLKRVFAKARIEAICSLQED